MPKSIPSQIAPPLERLLEVLDYNPQTGELYWRQCFDFDPETGRCWWRCTGWIREGDVAGRIRKDGRCAISIDGKLYLAHHIVWFLEKGFWPSLGMDHKDLNPSNNRIDNLRLATDSQNRCNCGRGKDNKSGFKGVSWEKRRSCWRATITLRGKQIHLGHFPSAKSAAAAYAAAAQKYHGKFARLE